MARYLLILFLLGFTACKSVKKDSSYVHTVKDSTIIIEKMVPVLVPGAEIRTERLNMDSLVQLLKSGVPASVINRTTIVEDPETKLKVGILIDELGYFTAMCEKQEQMINVLQQEISRYRTEREQSSIVEVRTKSSFWPNFTLILVLALVAIFILIKLKNRFF